MSFAGSPKRTGGFGGGYSPSKKQAPSPPEPVTIIVHRNQVVKLMIPFQSPLAKNIRACMHSNILNQAGFKIFIYTDSQGWTNVALDSTVSVPKLTEEPLAAVRAAQTAFTACTGVPASAVHTA